MSPKIAQIEVIARKGVVTIEYRDAPSDAPDLTGFIPEMVAELLTRPELAGKPIIYRDSHGVWDEVVIEDGKFAGYRSLGSSEDRAEAITRVISLQGMIEDAATNPAAASAIRLLTIFKDGEGNTRPVDPVSNKPMTEDGLMQAMSDGLLAVVLAKCNTAHTRILAEVAERAPADPQERALALETLDQVRAAFAELLIDLAPAVAEMVDTVIRAKHRAPDEIRARAEAMAAKEAMEQASKEVKH